MALTDGEFRVDLNGVLHWCRIAGSIHQTPPLLILHGGPGGNVYNFERTIGPLLETFATVLYFEQRGCGRSDAPDDPNAYSIPLLVADLDALRRTLELEQVIPLGFSFGGEIALEYALAYPTSVTKVVVQAPGVSLPGRTAWVQLYGFEQIADGMLRYQFQQIIAGPESPEEKLARVWSIVGQHDVDRFLFHQPEVAVANRRMWQESGLTNTGLMARALHKRDHQQPLTERVGNLNCPVLVLVGLYDRNSGVDVNRDLALRLPQAQLVIFERSAHFPDMEEPERYAQQVQTFVSALAG
jgi:proline iminopeptidase